MKLKVIEQTTHIDYAQGKVDFKTKCLVTDSTVRTEHTIHIEAHAARKGNDRHCYIFTDSGSDVLAHFDAVKNMITNIDELLTVLEK